MKHVKKLKMILAFALVLAMVSPVVLPIGNVAVAEAKTKTKVIKLSKTKSTITVGSTVKLTVTGTTSKITWTSSKTKIATVDATGTVTGVKAGTATITAAVDSKKYTCKVTVKNAKVVTNAYTEKTSYESVAIEAEGVNYVIPKDWTYETNKSVPGIIINTSKSADTTKDITQVNSIITTVLDNTGVNTMDYATLKAYIEGTIKTQADTSKAAGYTDFTYTISDYTYINGTAIMADVAYTFNGIKTVVKAYVALTGDKLIQINATDVNDGTTPAPATVALDMLNSLQVVAK